MIKRQSIHIVFKLAWRNLWRNHRRTSIMLSAITLGVWSMIFMTALMRGIVEDAIDRGINQLPGEIKIHHPKYLDDPSIANRIPEPDTRFEQELNRHAQQQLNHNKQSPLWLQRIKVPAMIASERESRGVELLAINPDKEKWLFDKTLYLSEGEFLSGTHDQGIIIGQALADSLETQLGKRVVITSQDPDNNLVERGLRIIGIYTATTDTQEKYSVFMALNTVQALLNTPNTITEIAIFTNNARQPEEVLEKIKLTAPPGTSVRSWKEINSYLESMVGVMDGFVLIWVIVIFMAMSFGLANTLIMAIFERVREIGLMLALGMRPKMILADVLCESALLILLGLTLGNICAVASIYAIKDGIDLSAMAEAMAIMGAGTTLTPALFIKDMITANSIVFTLGLLTCFIPAWQASRYDPIQALTKN